MTRTIIENCKINDCCKRDLIWEIEELRADNDKMRKTLELIADGAQDQLQVTQAKGCLMQLRDYEAPRR